MLRSLFGSDWRNSPAHLLLLSEYLRPRLADYYNEGWRKENWQSVLREAPRKAISRFLDDGMLAPTSLADHLGHKFKVGELKSMAKERGLSVSGRKEDLMSRLVEMDEKGMRKAVSGLSVLQCTERGRVLAEQYLAQEKEKRDDLERQVVEALRRRRFKEASQFVAAYNAQQVFVPGMGIDWKHYDSTPDAVMLTRIFAQKPKMLAHLGEEQLAELRLVFSVRYLLAGDWWKWLPSGLDREFAAAAYTHVSTGITYQQTIEEYRLRQKDMLPIKSIEVRNCNDDHVCPACRNIAGRKYTLNNVPGLPHEKCTSSVGCRCFIVGSAL